MTTTLPNILPVDDPRFHEFLRGVLYTDMRQQIGVRLNDFQARDLMRDELALMAYYQAWTPDHRPVDHRRYPKMTGAQRLRAIAAGVSMAVVSVLVIALGVVAALAAFSMMTSGVDVPVIGG